MSGVEPSAVDVVIPVRDGARYLRQCLDSVMAQTRPVRAAVVVDDGSTDATPDILADYQRHWPALDVVRTEKRGLPHARNTGIARCHAPFIAFLDSDDVWAANKLERQLPLFAANVGVGFVYCGYSLMDGDGRPSSRRVIAPTLRGDVLAELLIGGNLISGSGSAVVARRSLLERAGGFDEGLSFAEDWDLWLRFAHLSEVDFVPEPLVTIRLHDESMQHRNARHKLTRQLLQRLRVLDRWQDTLPPAVRAQFRRDVVSVAIKEIWQEPLAGWFHAWQLVGELRESDSSFARSLFSGRVDFFREFPVRIASAVRRGVGWPRSRTYGAS